MGKENIWISIRYPNIQEGCFILLKTTEDKKEYVDYLEINKFAGKGKHELLFTVPIKDIIDVQFKKPFLLGNCSLAIYTKNNNQDLSHLIIERYSFDKSILNKLKKTIFGK